MDESAEAAEKALKAVREALETGEGHQLLAAIRDGEHVRANMLDGGDILGGVRLVRAHAGLSHEQRDAPLPGAKLTEHQRRLLTDLEDEDPA